MNVVIAKDYVFKDAAPSLVKTRKRKVTAQDKAQMFKHFMQWVKHDFAEKYFDAQLYSVLKHCFKLSACMQREWFLRNYTETLDKQLKFVQQCVTIVGINSDYRDVELAIASWLDANRVCEQLQDAKKAEKIQLEYNQYEALKRKFEKAPPVVAQEG